MITIEKLNSLAGGTEGKGWGWGFEDTRKAGLGVRDVKGCQMISIEMIWDC